MVFPDQKLLREYIFQLQNSNPHLEVFHRTLKMLSLTEGSRRVISHWVQQRQSFRGRHHATTPCSPDHGEAAGPVGPAVGRV